MGLPYYCVDKTFLTCPDLHIPAKNSISITQFETIYILHFTVDNDMTYDIHEFQCIVFNLYCIPV